MKLRDAAFFGFFFWMQSVLFSGMQLLYSAFSVEGNAAQSDRDLFTERLCRNIKSFFSSVLLNKGIRRVYL